MEEEYVTMPEAKHDYLGDKAVCGLCFKPKEYPTHKRPPMKDWRGYTYKEESLNAPCQRCGEPAVRNCCAAEGDENRTHWHGLVHTMDGGMEALCRKCADKENKARIEWRNAQSAERKP